MRRPTTEAAPRPGLLPDYVRPGLRVLFVGINPGIRSAATGHHFAGPGNRFWRLLHDAGLTPVCLTPVEDHRLLEWGLGLTNLIARPTRGVGELVAADYAAGRAVLLRLLRRTRPALVGLVGVTLARVLLGPRTSGGGRVRTVAPVGPHANRLADIPVFVVPNPSGRNAHFTYPAMLAHYRALGRRVGGGHA